MRCFIAIELPDTLRARLINIQKRLSVLGKGVRWTCPEQLHLTVKFLGEVPEARAAEICEATRRVARGYPTFDLKIAGMGCFPPRGPVHVIWAGIADLPAPLVECQKECEETFAVMGFKREARAYSPHLTLGRVNDAALSHRIRQELQACAAVEAGTFTAKELVMFQSELRPQGSIHTPMATAPFHE